MKIYRTAVLAGLLLTGCQSASVEEKPSTQPEQIDHQWHASTLSDETIAKAKAASLEYKKCLAKETNARADGRGDPRDIANTILITCDGLLPAIKTAYDAENVPAYISERDIRKNRSQGAQMVLRTVMAVHAQRFADEEEAKEAASKKKNKSN